METGGLQLEWPWMLGLLPLPWLLRRLLPPATGHEAAVVVPFFDDLISAMDTRPATARRWPLLLAALAWALLVLAAARPQRVGDPVATPLTGRDLMLAVDLSRSMEQADFEIGGQVVDRLTAVKAVASNFIERRMGDRLGLILFGERAYLQAPPTFDRSTVRQLLIESVIGLAGDATAIGDAIGLAVKRLRTKAGEPANGTRVLVLLTDGANTAGEVAPLNAAEIASAAGLRIHTIGIGSDHAARRLMFGRGNPGLDLDEPALRAIAETTGGRYFRARDTDELNRIYTLLDEIEPVFRDAHIHRPVTALFHWPLTISLGLGSALLLTLGIEGRRAPRTTPP